MSAARLLGIEYDELILPPDLEPTRSGEPDLSGPPRELAQRFDFIEVAGGSGRVSDEVAALGLIVGPIVDLSKSRLFDMANDRVLEWI